MKFTFDFQLTFYLLHVRVDAQLKFNFEKCQCKDFQSIEELFQQSEAVTFFLFFLLYYIYIYIYIIFWLRLYSCDRKQPIQVRSHSQCSQSAVSLQFFLSKICNDAADTLQLTVATV